MCEPYTTLDQAIESSTSPLYSRTREYNSIDELDDRFLCVLDQASTDPLETDLSTTPLDRLAFEHDSSEDTMVDDARKLAFLPDLTDLTQTKLDYDKKNVVSSAHDEGQ